LGGLTWTEIFAQDFPIEGILEVVAVERTIFVVGSFSKSIVPPIKRLHLDDRSFPLASGVGGLTQRFSNMIQALAPRMPRGFSWVWLAIVAIAWAPLTSLAQSPTAPPGDDKAQVEDKKAAEKDVPADDEPATQIFTDPNAKKALSVFAPLNFAGPALKVGNAPDDRLKVQSMAARTINTDPAFLGRYVEFFAVELTRRDYLNALLNPPAGAKPGGVEVRGLERAVDALTMPMIVARAQANPNTDFLNLYTKTLFESSLPKILENNYLTRIDAMIVLGMAGGTTNQALDVYINQIKKPEQVIWVKLWAARGLTNAAQGGKFDIDALKANQGAEALIGFLESDAKLPWPAQIRALEALGALRVATANMSRGKIDAASVVMKVLADPEARPEVRAWAAWALGMMKVPQGVAPFNFNLIGYELGQIALDLGAQIVDEYDDHANNFEKEKVQAEHLTAILLFQVYPALIGEDGIRDSGLLKSPHPTAKETNTKTFLSKLDEQVKGICRESYELLRAPSGSLKGKRNDLDAKVASLKQLLEHSSPKDRHLVPGGPEFEPTAGEAVAGAPRP
jgi:hypothetical protein